MLYHVQVRQVVFYTYEIEADTDDDARVLYTHGEEIASDCNDEELVSVTVITPGSDVESVPRATN